MSPRRLQVDPQRSLLATHGGITDFVRVAFSLRPRPDAEPIAFVVDRTTGAFNGMEVGSGTAQAARFLSGEPPLLFENPLDDLSPHLAVQYDYYVEAKRVLLSSLAAAVDKAGGIDFGVAELPAGSPTLETGRQVLLLAEKLTRELQHKVPRA